MTELDYLTACLLGLVQGLTEFLPVSSSGHLVIIQKMLQLSGDSPQMLLFTVATHVGTLAAVVVVFAGTFIRFLHRIGAELQPSFKGRRTALLIAWLGVVACIPTAAIGLGFKDQFERAFDSAATTAVGLLITGTLLFILGYLPRPRRGWRRMGWRRAALVGLAQGCAIMPGVSRSGSTICVALFLGIKRRWAVEFSFLIAAPAIAGAALLKLLETLSLPQEQVSAIPWGPILAGSVVAFITGTLALRILLSLVIRDKIHHFCYYCWVLGAFLLGYWILR